MHPSEMVILFKVRNSFKIFVYKKVGYCFQKVYLKLIHVPLLIRRVRCVLPILPFHTLLKAEMAAQSFPAVSRSDENTSLLADDAESYPLNTFLQLGYVEENIFKWTFQDSFRTCSIIFQ